MLPTVVIVTPPLLLLWYVRRHDPEPEPIGRILLTVIIGAVVFIGVLIFLDWGHLPLPIISNWWGYALMRAVEAGLYEETAKIGTLLWLGRYYFDRGRPLAWITHGAAIGAGFTMMENVGITYGTDGSLATAFHRSLGSGHLFYGVVAGYLLYLAYQSPMGRRWLALAFLVPISLHGLHNFLSHASDIHAKAATSGAQYLLYANIYARAGWTYVALKIGLVLWLPRRARTRQLRLKPQSETEASVPDS